MKVHGNSKKNQEPHHLYEIWDKKEKDVYKYGISDDPIEKDGLSKRVRSQISLFNNIVNWARFIGRIILKNIPGRKKALELEDEYIEAYLKKHGKTPRGNRKRRTRSKKESI
jgi:hypothetical protein